jgi:uncharacterized protein
MNALIIFVKNPVKGKVKTRLAASIGDKNALIIYNYLLDHTREITSELPVSRYLFYDETINFKDNWPSQKFKKYIQTGKDLGERMQNAFQTVFEQGDQQVLIIGSDCIDLDSSIINEAFTSLATHDFVIGPAMDGGYYLLGMSSIETSVFQNKNWSTNTVATDTLKDIKHLNKTCSILPQLSDVDTIEDLNAELKNLIK